MTFYDAKGGAGGCGIAAKAFEFVDLLIVRAVERVLACHCDGGCTECICDERCKEKNMVMSKAGAEVILKSLIGMEIDIDALPMGEEEAVPAGVETVVFATEVMGKNGRRDNHMNYEFRDGKAIKREKSDTDIIVIKDEPED